MPEITIKNQFNKKVAVAENSSVLLSFQNQGIDWMHACGGKGRCTTCAFRVIDGETRLSSKTPVEKKYMEEGRLPVNCRLACQTRCLGDVVIEVPKSNQLPHLDYGYE
jgi:2Fe-2S ferredoxin